eukprot:3338515-Alexandrium_andersonii.AAC.1
MSASLVGSEMCIRDSFSPPRLVEGTSLSERALAWAAPGQLQIQRRARRGGASPHGLFPARPSKGPNPTTLA